MAVIDPRFVQALSDLWSVRTSTAGLHAEPAFKQLEQVCADLYEGGGYNIGRALALNHAVRSLGAPCTQPHAAKALIGDVATAANELDTAFKQVHTRLTHICPLDYAEDLPRLEFGPVRLGRFEEAELEAIFDVTRLARYYPTRSLDTARLSQFHWLVVTEEVPVAASAGQRSMPEFCDFMDRDGGAIDPHKSLYPRAVETALFFLLLAPWEQWSTLNEVDWRGFRVPWVYSLNDDLFVSPAPPPDADSLSWQPVIFTTEDGDYVETDRPVEFTLTDAARDGMSQFCEEQWSRFQVGLHSDLLQTPIMHFLVRAFLSDGIDEFMAHLTTIEAALGLQADHHQRGREPQLKKWGATKRVGARLAAVMEDAKAAGLYADLFDLRSAFIHGRDGAEKIPTHKRVQARRLAAASAAAIVQHATRSTLSREDLLKELLDRGVALIAESEANKSTR